MGRVSEQVPDQEQASVQEQEPGQRLERVPDLLWATGHEPGRVLAGRAWLGWGRRGWGRRRRGKGAGGRRSECPEHSGRHRQHR